MADREQWREQWARRLDFVFFLVVVLLGGGAAVAFLALVKSTSAQSLFVVAMLGPLVVMAVALGVALRGLERRLPEEPPRPWTAPAAEPPQPGQSRRAA